MPDPDRELVALDTLATPVLLAGTALFGLALIVVVVTGGPARWIWICGCGIALGLLGVAVARRKQRTRP